MQLPTKLQQSSDVSSNVRAFSIGRSSRSFTSEPQPLKHQPFDDIREGQDINRPFRVIGSFSEIKLIQLVRLLQSTLRTADELDRALAAFFLHFVDDSVQVTVSVTAANRSQIVMLRQVGQRWMIVSVAMWVALRKANIVGVCRGRLFI